MSDTVFDVFASTDYTYLEIARGGIAGNSIIESENRRGVFKLRSGGQNSPTSEMEIRNSTATLHVHPEDYLPNYDTIVGNGIRVDGVDYEITALTGGKNFDTGVMEHLTFSLQVAEFSDYGSN